MVTKAMSHILFPPNYFPRQTLIAHPCNAYACSGRKCHSGKSGNPRRLYITDKGNILPESPNLSSAYILGNISDKEFAFDSDAMRLFTKDMKFLYQQVILVANHKLIPLGPLLDNITLLKNYLP